MITVCIDKLEEDICSSMTNSTAATRPVTLQLVVPASRCGSLIRKGGCKIKEIRESTEGLTSRWQGICSPTQLMGQSLVLAFCNPSLSVSNRSAWSCWSPPSKGRTISYQPMPSSSPVIFAGGQLTKLPHLAMQQSPSPMIHGNTGFSGIESSSPEVKSCWAGLDASAQTTSHELTVPNDLIGCIISRQGAKINQVRQISGAQMKIANPVEGSTDRQVTITGSASSINLAQYLISMRLSSGTGGMGSS